MRPMGMHWYTEFLFSKDEIKQSSNNLDYWGQDYVGFTEKHRQCWHKHISHIKHCCIVHKYAQYINGSGLCEQVARLKRWWKKRDITHVPSDVESISHDHLPESEITTSPTKVSWESGIGPGKAEEMGKDRSIHNNIRFVMDLIEYIGI